MISLANMVATDEDALICDMAETYGIFDMWSLPAQLVATLAIGLRDTSRIRAKMMEIEKPFDEFLLAAIYDRINWLCWTKTEDGVKGVNIPRRILDLLVDSEVEKNNEDDDVLLFESPEEFELARNRLIGE